MSAKTPPAAAPGPTGGQDPLLAPLTLAGVEMANAVALAPMTRISARPDGAVTARNAAYYQRFARGGFGLIITEGIYTDTSWSQGYLHQPGLATDAHAKSWRVVVEAVHSAGTPIIAQLMHAGSHSQGNAHRPGSAGPSAVPPRGGQLSMYRGEGPYPTPAAMDASEIAEVRRGFVAAARRAVAAGFDGVEIHGANGYLLDQFLTDYLNSRQDGYGGEVSDRVRLLGEVCADVVDAIGDRALVGVRISQTKVSDASHRWAGGAGDAEAIFTALRAAGVGYVHTTERDALAPVTTDGPATLASLAKQFTGAPVIANGSLGDPQAARTALSSGGADMIALGKSALADRDWPHAVKAGRPVRTKLHPDQFTPLADVKDFELQP